MELTAIIFSFMFLANTNPTSAETTASTTFTEPTTVNLIDRFPNRLRLDEILVQFCASEIDSNKIDSAFSRFGLLADSKASIKNVVQFYLENYEEHFDNLLLFINQASSLELQQIAYNTLVEAINLDQINPINVFSFERFIHTKFELISDDNMERQIYKELLSTLANHIKELATDLNKILIFINSNADTVRGFGLVSTIVQAIDLTNFTDMNRLFEFSIQLPRVNQIKLLSKLIYEMREKRQYRHVFHVICHIKLLRPPYGHSDCLVTALERELPSQVAALVENSSLWQIKSKNDDFLLFSPFRNVMFLNSKLTHSKPYNADGWFFTRKTYNSVTISYNYIAENYGTRYLSVECCLNNESFPTGKERNESDLSQNWYFLMSDDLTHTHVQLKNIDTNELLIVDDTFDTPNDHDSRVRLTMSSKCSDCDSSKWLLQLQYGNDLSQEFCDRKQQRENELLFTVWK